MIVLSKALDSPQVPRLVVEYVMFHEMLHLRYPVEHKGSRRCVHTPEFKVAEKEFLAPETGERNTEKNPVRAANRARPHRNEEEDLEACGLSRRRGHADVHTHRVECADEFPSVDRSKAERVENQSKLDH